MLHFVSRVSNPWCVYSRISCSESTAADPAPLKLPEIALATLKPPPVVGDLAPGFSIKTVDDQTLRLSDFRGKFVLLNFWATWCGPCVAELDNLKAVDREFAPTQRFAILGLSLDESPREPAEYAKTRAIGWRQAFIGPIGRVDDDYGAGIPSIWLIGPDGKVIAKGLRGDAIKAAVAKASN